MGTAVLGALGDCATNGTSSWLEEEDQDVIDAVLDAITGPTARAYDRSGAPPTVVEVIEPLPASGSASEGP